MEMNWSRWFHCESSFGLLLVPSQPGIFALAEEIVQPADGSRRMLAVFEVEEADDLSRAMSRVFAAGSMWREKLLQGRCYVRYALTASAADRRAAATALKNWMNSQREMAAQIFEQPIFEQPMNVPPAAAPVAAKPESFDDESKTIAERAVDRVTRRREFTRAFVETA